MATTSIARPPYTGGTFGSNVGQIPMPQPFEDLSSVYPNLTPTNEALSRNIQSMVQGIVPTDVSESLQDRNAAWNVGAGLGIPAGGTLGGNRLGRNLGLTSLDLINKGAEMYSKILPVVSQTQTVSPELQSQINFQNLVSAASPVPSMAAAYAKSLFDQYLSAMKGGGDEASMWSQSRPTQIGGMAPSPSGNKTTPFFTVPTTGASQQRGSAVPSMWQQAASQSPSYTPGWASAGYSTTPTPRPATYSSYISPQEDWYSPTSYSGYGFGDSDSGVSMSDYGATPLWAYSGGSGEMVGAPIAGGQFQGYDTGYSYPAGAPTTAGSPYSQIDQWGFLPGEAGYGEF